MPKFATLSVCVETSYRQTSAFVFLRDNRQNAEFGISMTTAAATPYSTIRGSPTAPASASTAPPGTPSVLCAWKRNSPTR